MSMLWPVQNSRLHRKQYTTVHLIQYLYWQNPFFSNVLFVDHALSAYIVLGLHWPRQNNALAELRVSNIEGAQFFYNVVYEADDWAQLEIHFCVIARDFEIFRIISSSARKWLIILTKAEQKSGLIYIRRFSFASASHNVLPNIVVVK